MLSYHIELQHEHAQYCINRVESPRRQQRQQQRQVRKRKGRRRNHPSSCQVSRSPSSVLPSHDFSRTQQRSRLKFKEKLGFAIPVGHFQTVQAGQTCSLPTWRQTNRVKPNPSVHGSGGQASSAAVFRGPRLVGVCTPA